MEFYNDEQISSQNTKKINHVSFTFHQIRLLLFGIEMVRSSVSSFFLFCQNITKSLFSIQYSFCLKNRHIKYSERVNKE